MRPPPSIAAALPACLLLASCSQIIPEPGFDARTADQTVRNLTFKMSDRSSG